MNKKKEIKGILLRDFAADPMTPEEWERVFFRNSPEAAYKEIVVLRGLYERAMSAAKESHQLAGGLLDAWQRGAAERNAILAQAQSAMRLEKKRLDALDQKAATAANKRRADMARDEIAAYVRKRLEREPYMTEQRLVADSIKQVTVKKNKDGKPYTKGYLSRMASEEIGKVKAALRSRR
jgi:hypothetical protein